MKEKVCKHCKLFVKGDKCPLCQMSAFSRVWKGIIYIRDPANSEAAQLLHLTAPGKYTLWTK